MKKVLFVLMIMISATAMSAQEVSLSLKDCIVLSESNNPYIKNTYLDVQSARFQKKEVFAEYFPRLSFRTLAVSSYDYFLDIVIGAELGKMVRDMEMGGLTKYGFNSTLTLMQPLYAGGRINAGNKLAEAGIKAAELKHKVKRFYQNRPLLLNCQIEHWTYACNDIRTIVVEALSRELDVERQRYISCLDRLPRYLTAVLFAENNIVLPEVHCRDCAQREMVAQTQVGKHTHAEPWVILRNIGKPGLTVLGNKTIVREFHILHMHAHKKAVVQTAVIDIRFVLHLTFLSHRAQRQQQQEQYVKYFSFHTDIITR